MELSEQVRHRVNAKADRFAFWIEFWRHPMVVCPGIVAAGLSPQWAMKLVGKPWAGIATMAGWVALLVCAHWKSFRPFDAATGVFWQPAWTAFCAVVQGRKESTYSRLYMKPMCDGNADWRAMVEREAQAYDQSMRQDGCVDKQDWVALRTIEYLVDQGEKTQYWSE